MWLEILEAVKAISGWADTARGWLSLQRDARSERRDRLIDALVEVHRAANITRAYLADASLWGIEEERLPANMKDTLDVRRLRGEVCEAWVRVADKLMRCDASKETMDLLKPLSQQAFEKARFWAAPKEWRGSGVDIGLSKLVEDLSQTLEDLRVPGPRA